VFCAIVTEARQHKATIRVENCIMIYIYIYILVAVVPCFVVVDDVIVQYLKVRTVNIKNLNNLLQNEEV
jgi:hypothetical protein